MEFRLRVTGTWLEADLSACVEIIQPTTRITTDNCYSKKSVGNLKIREPMRTMSEPERPRKIKRQGGLDRKKDNHNSNKMNHTRRARLKISSRNRATPRDFSPPTSISKIGRSPSSFFWDKRKHSPSDDVRQAGQSFEEMISLALRSNQG
uniref:Uncharacterized protein n=1 Tax=Coccidioides posadasii RMSCC 3488 TaxID=454284 RepID=A0A0J6FS58_COCPO|nr:hypothetical protein CPAG_09492 [Coccidioides posadasii RMSCC 3488]